MSNAQLNYDAGIERAARFVEVDCTFMTAGERETVARQIRSIKLVRRQTDEAIEDDRGLGQMLIMAIDDKARLRDALAELLAADDAVTAFVLTASPSEMGEGAWRREHAERYARRRKAIDAARSAAGKTPPPERTAVEDIAAERRRQIEQEGNTRAHDDSHVNGELAFAAACYATSCPFQHDGGQLWPWDWSYWKPKNRRFDLVRAGALIVAEIERLDRVGKAGT